MKLSEAQERVLREVADGYVTLVYVGENAHSYRMRDALGKGNRKVNRQYDFLVTHKFIAQGGGVMFTSAPRPVGITQKGFDYLVSQGAAGSLLDASIQPGTDIAWMIRYEEGAQQQFVLYKNGQVYERYSQLMAAWAVYRKYCPLGA